MLSSDVDDNADDDVMFRSDAQCFFVNLSDRINFIWVPNFTFRKGEALRMGQW